MSTPRKKNENDPAAKSRLHWDEYKLPMTPGETQGLTAHTEAHLRQTGTYWGFIHSAGIGQTEAGKVNFNPQFPLSALKPADYNPRKIGPEAEAMLRESVAALGVLKPIIADTSGTIIAGHQRTNQLKAIGITHAPTFVLDPMAVQGEIRFNLLHNAADLEISDGEMRLAKPLPLGWHSIDAGTLEVSERPSDASLMAEIHYLLDHHGSFGAAVALDTGEIIVHAVYAYCCHVTRRRLEVVVVPAAQRETLVRFFGAKYGEYSYEHLPRSTWNQTLAQMFRCRSESRGRSRTYDRGVIPKLTKTTRVLDFGAGQKDYALLLREKGYPVTAVEFFLRKRGGKGFDTQQTQADIDELCSELRDHGGFDIVVADSVLNSIDSVQAETDVLTCLNAFCRPGGIIIFSGRNKKWTLDRAVDNQAGNKKKHRRKVEFMDADGFTGMFRAGAWFFQRFHSRDEALALGERFAGPSQYFDVGSGWRVEATKAKRLPARQVEASLRREFDLPLPDGDSVGRADDIVAVWQLTREQREAA